MTDEKREADRSNGPLSAFDISRWARYERVHRAALTSQFLLLALFSWVAVLALAERNAGLDWRVLASSAVGTFALAYSTTRWVRATRATSLIILIGLVIFAFVAASAPRMNVIILALVAIPLVLIVRGAVSSATSDPFGVPLGLARATAAGLTPREAAARLTRPSRFPSRPARTKRICSIASSVIGVSGCVVILANHFSMASLAAVWGYFPGAYVQDAIGFGLFLAATTTLRYGQRVAASSAQAAMARDPRSPVLFLRSFADDPVMAFGGGSSRARRLAEIVTGRASRLEEVIARELAAWGPVIAIGQPGEPLPELGAARFYEGDDTWRAAITSIVPRARIIVVVVADTEGLAWELSEIDRLGRSDAVIYVMPPVAKKETVRRWRRLADLTQNRTLRLLASRRDASEARVALRLKADAYAMIVAKRIAELDFELATRLASFVLIGEPKAAPPEGSDAR